MEMNRYRSGGHVLVVDDDDVNREVLRVVLEAQGYVVSEAVDGQTALEAAGEEIDMVLLDFMMPCVDGMQVCRQLKQSTTTASIPVIMVSACTGRDVRLQGIEAGADDFLNKPLDFREVLLRVRNAVAARR